MPAGGVPAARLVLAVAAGGAIGSVLRYLLSSALDRAFPWGTLAVNVTGCFAIGLALGAGLGAGARALLVVGVLGGFTTMSAFSAQAVALVQHERLASAALYVGGTLATCLMATAAGLALATRMWGPTA